MAEANHLLEVFKATKQREGRFKTGKDRLICRWRRQKFHFLFQIKFSKIPPVLRPFILGDCLLKSSPSLPLDEIKRRYSLKDRVVELMETCKAHPQSALDFCTQYPQGTIQDYLELQENTRKVFSILGNKIMLMLSPATREKLKRTVLDDVFSQFQNRDLETLIIRELKSQVSEKTAKEILQHDACQQRIQRGGDEIQLANKLLAFWKSKDDPIQRQSDLEVALNARGLELRSDSRFCREYIKGLLDVDLDEIVGIMEITAELFKISHVAWSLLRHTSEAEFRRCLLEEELTLDQSVKQVLYVIDPEHLGISTAFQFSDSDDDSYLSPFCASLNELSV